MFLFVKMGCHVLWRTNLEGIKLDIQYWSVYGHEGLVHREQRVRASVVR